MSVSSPAPASPAPASSASSASAADTAAPTQAELLDFVRYGPVEYAGQWWYIPADADDKSTYTPAPPELAATLTQHRDRLTRVDDLTRRYS